MMQAIFISYRRDDSEGQAGRLYDDLARQFGDRSVFMDVAAIEPGLDFRKVIDKNVASCGVLLAVIGPAWLDAKDETGQRRLDNPLDFVRLETAAALRRDIPVVPVLVRGARMPKSDQLPDDLKELSYRNGMELTHARWDSDIEVLISALRRHVGDEARQPVDENVESPQPAAPVGTGQPTPPRMLTSVPEGTSNKSRVVIVGGIVAVIVAAIIGISYYERSNASKTVTNQGQPVPVPPTIKVFAATPTQLTKGGKVTIRWEVANADDVKLEPFGQVPSSGSSIDEPQQTTIYKLSATNKSGGKSGTFQEVIVSEPTPRRAEKPAVTPTRSIPVRATRNTPPTDFVSVVKGTSPLAYFRLESRSGASEVGNANYSFSSGVTNSASGAPIGISQNYCAVLNGSNGKIDTSQAGGIAETGSIMIWLNLAALPSAEGHIFYLVGESEFRNDFDLQIETDDTLKFYTGGAFNIAYRPDPGTLVNRWHLVIATLDKRARTLYWDGRLVQTDLGGGGQNKTRQLSIGASTFFSGRVFHGNLDEVALWNRALSASEVGDIYNSTKANH